MMFVLLPLLLAGTPIAADNVAPKGQVTRMASASVKIIRAERIGPLRLDVQFRKPDRQVRQREARPLIEFF
ncbi:MAG: hypothetical protein IBJ12_10535 [Sphingomonadaceae bacterium]|nr:hypothetical protein [Sphingomonadaceae bacterium]